MSKRDRRKERRGILRTVVTLIALCFGAAGIYWLGNYQTEYLNRQEEGARERSSDSDSRCYSVFALPAICISGDNDARAEAERSEQDLQAQQNMAEWAKWLTMFTAAQIAIGLLGTVLLYRTIGLTRKGNRINRRVGEAQVRAYLSITDAVVTPRIDTNCLDIAITIKNLGTSPATKFNYCYFIRTFEHPHPLYPTMTPNPRSRENKVQWPDFASNGDYRLQPQGDPLEIHHIVTDMRFEEWELDAARAGQLGINLALVTRFVDVFGVTILEHYHFTAMALKVGSQRRLTPTPVPTFHEQYLREAYPDAN